LSASDSEVVIWRLKGLTRLLSLAAAAEFVLAAAADDDD